MELLPDKVEYVPELPINRECQTYSFHYAPYYSDAYRQRAVAIANWVAETKPTAVVVDVSAEITQYLRWLGVPVIGMRQHGDRSDLPHLCGYDAAYKLLAPYPEFLEIPGLPSWIKNKTIYAPGFSRYTPRQETQADTRKQLNLAPTQKVVLVINGSGGNKYSLARIITAAEATPEWRWLIVGQIEQSCLELPHNLDLRGWCNDTYVYLKAADVAIASGGHNTVMEIGTAKVPFLCIPEPRPFDEQQSKAQILEKLGLCMVADRFPHSNLVDFVLKELEELDVSKWSEIMATDGAAQAAQAIESEVKLLASYQNRKSNRAA